MYALAVFNLSLLHCMQWPICTSAPCL